MEANSLLSPGLYKRMLLCLNNAGEHVTSL